MSLHQGWGHLSDGDSKGWRQLYQDALFEVDMSKLPAKIDMASNAVQAKLRRVAELREDSSQRNDLLDALQTLEALRRGRP